jgi:hypothetical protein
VSESLCDTAGKMGVCHCVWYCGENGSVSLCVILQGKWECVTVCDTVEKMGAFCASWNKILQKCACQCYPVCLFLCMGLKLGPSHWEENIGWDHSRQVFEKESAEDGGGWRKL